mmetsp:Transcript_30992/g.56202  ORF Transcript_30992/g.56202 Transcript_30992/m.56202 type:complete len:83 (-) Transcript_30992:764-1012(-)
MKKRIPPVVVGEHRDGVRLHLTLGSPSTDSMDSTFRLEGIPCFVLIPQEMLLRISHQGSNGDTSNDDTIYAFTESEMIGASI